MKAHTTILTRVYIVFMVIQVNVYRWMAHVNSAIVNGAVVNGGGCQF
jgi:hypothetical protein